MGVVGGELVVCVCACIYRLIKKNRVMRSFAKFFHILFFSNDYDHDDDDDR